MKTTLCALLILLIAGQAMAGGKRHVFDQTGSYQYAYKDSTIDTVQFSWTAKTGVGIYFNDSTKLRAIIVQRIVNGRANALAAGDTLYQAYTYTDSSSISFSYTPTPYVDSYRIIIPFDYSGNSKTKPAMLVKLRKE